MRTLFVICFLVVAIERCNADYVSPTYFCKELARQRIVDINQLTGIWYVIEKLVHIEDRLQHIKLTTCPVVRILEDRDFLTTASPFQQYHNTYGAQYPYSHYDGTVTANPSDPVEAYNQQRRQEEYLRQSQTYGHRDYSDAGKGYHKNYIRKHYDEKFLKMYMSDGFLTLEHHLRYNSSDPGLWIITDQQGIQSNLKHFGGTIQVLKAVGTHMILTTCQSSREVKEFYSLILSRENYLQDFDKQTSHGFILQQGLKGNYIEQSCNGAEDSKFRLVAMLLVFVPYFVVF